MTDVGLKVQPVLPTEMETPVYNAILLVDLFWSSVKYALNSFQLLSTGEVTVHLVMANLGSNSVFRI